MNKFVLSLFCCITFHTIVSSQKQSRKPSLKIIKKMGSEEAVRSILIDKQNYKWLGTDKGLYRMISMDMDPEKL
ncbi:MAG: hypothetical protein IPL42_08505 [Saprospiraceae bacterium]|nr:hypothetical protein [Saprospiraceae bacterium]